MMDLLTSWVPVAIWAIGGIVWLARLEMQVRFIARQQEQCLRERWKKDENTVKRLESIEHLLTELRTDVKWLRRIKDGKDDSD